ncbi:MAG: FG-GAP-like repeat-containing protein, partial [Nannocystaceae bacterium]
MSRISRIILPPFAPLLAIALACDGDLEYAEADVDAIVDVDPEIEAITPPVEGASPYTPEPCGGPSGLKPAPSALRAVLASDAANAETISCAVEALGLDAQLEASLNGTRSAYQPQPGDWFGSATAFGDFDGDDNLELAVGAPWADNGTITDSGLVQLYEYTGSYVTTLVASDSLAQIGSENKLDEMFGHALAVGDFNGDGLDDLAIAAVGDDDYRGAVFIYHGSQTGLVLHGKLTSASFPGEQRAEYESFGAALAVGDFNGDGRDDLAIGAPGWEWPRPGKVTVFNGSSTGLSPAQLLRESSPDTVDNCTAGVDCNPLGPVDTESEFGASLAAGQLHDWGYQGDSLVVGALRGRASNGERSGLVYTFLGDMSGDFGGTAAAPLVGWQRIDQQLWTNEYDDRFGTTVAVVQLDGGVEELLVGAPGENENSGAVFAFSNTGGTDLSATYDWHQGMIGGATREPGDSFGQAIAGSNEWTLVVGSHHEAPGPH